MLKTKQIVNLTAKVPKLLTLLLTFIRNGLHKNVSC